MKSRVAPSDLERPMTAVQAGDYLQIHPKTLMRLARQGKLPGKKIGHCWRFLPSVLDTFQRDVDPKK